MVSAGDSVGKGGQKYACWQDYKVEEWVGKTAWKFLLKIRLERPYDAAIFLPESLSEENKNNNLKRHLYPSCTLKNYLQ